MRKAIAKRVFLVAIAILPFFIINWMHDTPFSILGEYQLGYQSIIILVLAICHPSIWFGAFMACCLASHYIYGFQPLSGFYLFNVFVMAVWYVIVQKLLDRGGVIKAIAISCLLIALSMVAEFVGIMPLTIGDFTIGQPLNMLGKPIPSNWHVTGLSGVVAQQNMTGTYLAICLSVFFAWHTWALGAIAVLLFMSKANFAVIAAACAALAYQAVRPGRKVRYVVGSLCIGLFLAVGFCFVDRPDYQTRIAVLRGVWELMTVKAVMIGHGLGSFPSFGCKDGYARIFWMNNEYAQVYQAMGIVGLGVVMGYIGHFIIMVKRAAATCDKLTAVIIGCAVATLVAACGTHTFHHPLLGPLSVTVLALANKVLGIDREVVANECI